MRLIAAVLLSVTLAQGQSLSPRALSEIDALFQRAVEQGTVPGVVAVVARRDQILYYKAFGMRDVAAQKPMAADSIFRIASMTKPITSAAIMLLQEQGKLRVDDPVSKYLPEFRDRESLRISIPQTRASPRGKPREKFLFVISCHTRPGWPTAFQTRWSDRCSKRPVSSLTIFHFFTIQGRSGRIRAARRFSDVLWRTQPGSRSIVFSTTTSLSRSQ